MKALSQEQLLLLGTILRAHSPDFLPAIEAPQVEWTAELRNVLCTLVGDELARSGLTAEYDVNVKGRELEQLIDAIVDLN